MTLLARAFPQPVAKGWDYSPTVTAIMSVHNAAALVELKLENLLALDYPRDLLDIVVICDGCTDDTAALCRRMGSPRITVIESPVRRGKAECLNDAVAAATGEVLLMTDVRQRIDPNAMRQLAANFLDHGVGAVSGELRFEDAQGGFGASVDAYWKYEKAIRQAESKSGSVIGVTGALYALRKALWQPLPAGTVLDDVLVPMRVVKAGRRVVFEPAAVAWDKPSRNERDERARKVRTLAGNYQLISLAPWLLLPGLNPVWTRFVGHKLLRLLAPWLLCALIASTLVLAPHHVFFAICLCLAVLCLGLVLLGRLLPAVSGLLPVRLLTAFLYMNLYSAQGLVAFVRRPVLHLW